MKQFEELENINVEFDEISPITGNKSVLIEADPKTGEESKICLESGYTTRDHWTVDEEGELSETLKEYETKITELMIDSKYIDGEGSVWYLANMVTPGVILYPIGESATRFEWEVAMVIRIWGDERLKYPIPGKEGEYYTKRVDMENAKRFHKNSFAEALNEFYSIVQDIIKNPGQE